MDDSDRVEDAQPMYFVDANQIWCFVDKQGSGSHIILSTKWPCFQVVLVYLLLHRLTAEREIHPTASYLTTSEGTSQPWLNHESPKKPLVPQSRSHRRQILLRDAASKRVPNQNPTRVIFPSRTNNQRCIVPSTNQLRRCLPSAAITRTGSAARRGLCLTDIFFACWLLFANASCSV